MEDINKFMNTSEAARYLGFQRTYLYKLIAAKKIPCHNPTGRHVLFDKSELDEWVRRH